MKTQMIEKRMVIPSLLKNGYAILLFFLICLFPQTLVAMHPADAVNNTTIPGNDCDTKNSPDFLTGEIYITEGVLFISQNTTISSKIIDIKEKVSEKNILTKKNKKSLKPAGILKAKANKSAIRSTKKILQKISKEYPETYSISGLIAKSIFISVTSMKLFSVIQETENNTILILLTLIFFAASFYRSISITTIPPGQLFQRPPPKI